MDDRVEVEATACPKAGAVEVDKRVEVRRTSCPKAGSAETEERVEVGRDNSDATVEAVVELGRKRVWWIMVEDETKKEAIKAKEERTFKQEAIKLKQEGAVKVESPKLKKEGAVKVEPLKLKKEGALKQEEEEDDDSAEEGYAGFVSLASVKQNLEKSDSDDACSVAELKVKEEDAGDRKRRRGAPHAPWNEKGLIMRKRERERENRRTLPN